MENEHLEFYHSSLTKKAEKTSWNNLHGCSIGLAITSVAITNPLVIITPDVLTSSRLEQEIAFFGNKDALPPVFTFPGWETLPYDHFSPHEDVVSQRLFSLHQLSHLQSWVLLVTASTLMHRLPPKIYVESNSFVLAKGDHIDFVSLRKRFETHGYRCVNKVMEHGEFAVRGSIIDIFPMGSKNPLRIDLLDTIVDSIRTFDADTQRSLQIIDDVKLLPAKEFPLDDKATDKFCHAWKTRFGASSSNSQIYQSILANKPHPGIEYYLPLFFEHTDTLFNYFPTNSTVITVGNVEDEMHLFWQEINERYEQLRHDQTRPIIAPEDIFIAPDQVLSTSQKFAQVFINDQKIVADKIKDKHQISICFETKKIEKILPNETTKTRDAALRKLIETSVNARILFITSSPGKHETAISILQNIGISPTPVATWQEFIQSAHKIAILIAPLELPAHIIFKENQEARSEILIITEEQIFGEQTRDLTQPTTISTRKTETIIHDLIELRIGAPVVHIDYGIGRYLGLQKLQINNEYEAEFLLLEYADNARLYVPVTSFSLISRYTGTDPDNAPLNQLGSKQWEKTKHAAEKQIRDAAAELLEIYANRQKARGFPFVKPEGDYERFTAAFPFTPTLDQKRAIDEVIADMTSSKPMDRLICGDVGFGKTEVAMHAAFLAIANNKQVAILTPTTLLAQQHFTNFQERFSAWPIKIKLFSRFCNPKEQESTTADLASGKIDIVIGTHKLLQKTIQFKNLALLIIDEEHRFGVKQKESIKEMAIGIDILALTATPIPRTLNMAFAGIRDFSIIATPPAKRLAIKTFVHEYDPYLIKEVILRETMRGGQVYFLHNDITTIEKTARELQRLVPTINVAIAHGQMRKQQLEQIMRDFYNLRTNVLVCTTIIESGLDVPTANAIIINRADRFGLAQLHQIRGRVGRSHHQAYAYLIVPPASLLTPDAKKRLDAIVAMKDLGTGFVLATHDLEIRGAGELLGEKQSGAIQGIGFTLYMEMLEHAVKTLKNRNNTAQSTSKSKTEFELQVSALIPDQYINDVNQRLVLYKKISDAKDQSILDELQIEMIDRFGLLPEYTKNLFKIASLKLKSETLGIKKITIGTNKGIIEFVDNCKIEPQQIIRIIKKHSTTFKFSGSYAIEFSIQPTSSKIDIATTMLDDITGITAVV